MAKPGSDRDGAMVDKQPTGKKSKDKLSPFTKTPKLDRSELLGKEAKAKSSMKRKLSFSSSPPPSEPRAEPRGEERDSDTDKDGPDKKRVKKESGGRKSQSSNLLFGYPLSERKQMALLMQMTANSPDSTPSHPSQTPPVQKKVPPSRQKDKVNKRNERGETPLHMAAIRGDAKQVKELISLGADVNVKDFAGWTPLHEACNLGYYDVAKVLIAAGAEVNTQGLDDDTPLHDASSSGHKDIVKLLLRHGGNAFQANKRGERPVDVADSQELEQLLKGELALSEPEDSSSDSEDPPSVNPSSVDDNMDDSDTEKDSDGKPKSSNSNVQGLDEYEFKDEEEEEDLSKALNERHILRRELRQREKEEKERNHVKQSGKGDKSKKQKSSRVHCSSDTSSDEMDSLPDKRNSPTCSQNSETHNSESRSKKDDQKLGKVKRKSKSRNKENQEDGKENSKTLVLSLATVSETTEKIREEDSFKMSFSPKDDSSVHLFHLSIKSPKLNNSLTDKQTPLKQENIDKYNHYTDSDYCTEGSSKGCKHKEKIKHQQKDNADGEDGHSSPYNKDGGIGNSIDSSDGAIRKTDTEGKVVKKHKLKHKEKDKHRREYEGSRHKLKEARKDGHRNLEFDREFWKENFFKSDDTEDVVKKEGEELKISSDSPSIREERKHSTSKEKRPKEEKDRKKDRKDDKIDGHTSGRSLEDANLKEEVEERAITVDPESLETSEKREKSEKKIITKDGEKIEKKHSDKDKKVKSEHSEERWKERDKSYKENEKLKSSSSIKRHDDGRKSKDKMEKRSDRESIGEHKEHRDKDRSSLERKNKLQDKSSDHSKSERSKDKECDKKRRDRPKDSSNSSSSNLKLLLEEKRGYISESGKLISGKSKEDVVRTPEKDRDRRERDRDLERHKDRDKDRHKERTPLAKPNKPKLNENDPDKAKLKASPAPQKDSKPKEKRLVNDDLMQTSFERMLSLKDQEIEQWHRKHMEKMKQKERERLKQRAMGDSVKPKLKDRTKPESCLSKELMRSKSSDTQEGKGLKDNTTQRTVSLDGKNLPSIGAKVMSVVENCLTRSPRPDSSDRLMSRSVSMVSVASSEDSSHATILTPKHTEYDSDMNLDASDSQPGFLQSSLVIQATRSPSIHDNSNILDASRTALPVRHESPCLRAILDEEALSDSKMVENIPKINVMLEETGPKDAPVEGDASLNTQTDTQQSSLAPDSNLDASVSQSKDIKDPTEPKLSISSSEPSTVQDVQCVVEKVDCKDHQVTTMDAGTAENSTVTTKEAVVNIDKVEVAESKDTTPESGEKNDQDNTEATSEHQDTSTTATASPMPSTSTANIPGSTPVESLPGFCGDAQEEDMEVDINDNKKSNLPIDAAVNIEEKKEISSEDTRQQDVAEVEGQSSSDNSGESKPDNVEPMEVENTEDKTDTQLNPEDQQLAQNVAETSSSSSSSSASSSTSSRSSSSSSSGSSNTSGSSSPQSGESDSCSGAKTKTRNSDEEIDVNVQHPRKRKMPKVSMQSQSSCSPQDKDKGQQSLAAMVDSVKLEEIEPYQTERANPYYEFLHIRKKIEEKRKVLCSVTPQPPQYYDEYVTFNGSYLLDGNPLSKLCIPTITPPPSLPEQLKEMFKQQEVVRMKLRLQHSIEREKLIVSNEQEVLRVHYRAARTLANQTLPFSACTVLLDAEVYNMPQDVQTDDGKTSVRDRFNARQFMSWLQDVDDKFDKLKTCLLMRQQHEAAALNAVQRLEWQLKLQELDPATYKSTSIFEIPEFYIPLVEVNDDFDLTPI
ncbi:ankyrin repeat domain-containing protein 12 isoform X2 [Boleophthalmus pectinirostris]|uniref:ankyrin repeat domain-containing protein 12 isoform X2 n=1 Tax=Boleophthalmus pectinirostris TaxID=150288 RepID=UPI0024314B56|nr:ankyrin repeat domain-containing protein 12 isoform X2 [Boleophthalmus pectinirostris]